MCKFNRGAVESSRGCDEMEKINVLMVDDQPAKLLSYEAVLDDLGENLIKANSVKEALEHLLKTDIAVMLLDVRMPELGGFEVAEMIRSHPRFQKTAIIFISAESLADTDKLDGYRRGAARVRPLVPGEQRFGFRTRFGYRRF
jgi:CheY-like chemotaxis protein